MHFPDFGQFRSGNFERKTFSSTTELRRKYMILSGEINVEGPKTNPTVRYLTNTTVPQI